MRITIFTGFVILLVIMMGILLFSQSNNDSELQRKVYFKEHYKKTPNKDIFMEYQGEKYHLAWSDFKGNGAQLEFLREGDKVKNYKKMITVVAVSPDVDFHNYLLAYLESMKRFQITAPLILKNTKSDCEQEKMIDALLWDGESHLEHILAKVYADKKGRVNSVVISTVWKCRNVQENMDVVMKEIKNRRLEKIEELENLYFETFP